MKTQDEPVKPILFNLDIMSKPVYQHYVPRVYLKQFQIDDNANRSFVYCINFNNSFKRRIMKVGVNDKLFKRKKYYNDSRYEDPYVIEKVFASEIEPKYNGILTAITEGVSIPENTRVDIALWLFMMQHRAPHIRDQAEKVMKWIINMQNKYQKKEVTIEEKAVINEYIQRSSKEIHLSSFSDKEHYVKLLHEHVSVLNAKHWKILKSDEGRFISNDNPGFSPNMIEHFAHQVPFHMVMELNASSIIYFVFSPYYCLEITPFMKGTPLDQCALKMDIKMESIDDSYIDFINTGTFYTRYNVIISNNKKEILNCMKNIYTSGKNQ